MQWAHSVATSLLAPSRLLHACTARPISAAFRRLARLVRSEAAVALQCLPLSAGSQGATAPTDRS